MQRSGRAFEHIGQHIFRSLRAFLEREVFRHIQPGVLVTVEHQIRCGGVGAASALLRIPDDVVLAVGILRVGQRPADGLSHRKMVDSIPEHTAGVDRVDVVHIAQHSPCAARQQRFGHRLIHAVRDAQELTGLGVDDGIAELARAVRIAEEIRRDAVKAVELDDAVSQQVKAVDDVFIQRGRFCQQDDGLGPGVLPERTVAVSIVGAVGAQDAQIVFVHPERSCAVLY